MTIAEQDKLSLRGQWSEVVRLREPLTDPDHSTTRKLWPLCEAYSHLKQYDKLSACLNKIAENVNQRHDSNMVDNEAFAKSNPSWAAVLSESYESVLHAFFITRAQAYLELGLYDKAAADIRAFDKFINARIAALNKRHANPLANFDHRYDDEKLEAYRILGLASALEGKRAEAEKQIEAIQGLDFRIEPALRFSPFSLPALALSTSLDTREKAIPTAQIRIALGDYAKALEALQGSSAIGVSVANAVIGALSASTVNLAYSAELNASYMYAKCYVETGQFEAAQTIQDKLLAIPQIRDAGEVYWLLLYDRGRVHEHYGETGKALERYRQALEVIEQSRRSVALESAKIGFVADKQAVYRAAIRLLFNEGRYDDAFEYVERSKARALVDMLASQPRFALDGAGAERARALLASQEAAETTARGEEVREKVSQARNLMVEAKKEIAVQDPQLASLVSVLPQGVRDLQALLRDGEALLEYYYDNERLYIFALDRSSMSAITLPSDALEDDVRTFRAKIQSVDNGYLPAAQRLYQRLVQPVAPTLSRSARLVIVPHGALHYLPFNALHDGSGFLINRHTVRVLPSAQVMKYLKPYQPARQFDGVLALGNPDLGDKQYDLAFAEREAKAVAALIPQSRFFVRRQASKTTFLEFAPAFRYVHIASHGEFDSAQPLKSRLLLSKDGAADGSLTVAELYQTRLNADLITLSACETGLGKVNSGDDVVGLTRGFLYAGAASVIASLWQVDDRATGELMEAFYGGLTSREKDAALRDAQIATQRKYPHPFFWAAFQLTGHPR